MGEVRADVDAELADREDAKPISEQGQGDDKTDEQ